MLELRKTPRINVSWRSGIKLPDGRLILCRTMNISSGGILLQSPHNLVSMRSYPMMLDIPGIDEPGKIFHVSCMGMIRHVVLSNDHYRIGVQLSEMSSLHDELFQAWISKAQVYNHA